MRQIKSCRDFSKVLPCGLGCGQAVEKSGERGRNRTSNLLIKSQLLCQLSYAPAVKNLLVGQFVIVAFLAWTVIHDATQPHSARGYWLATPRRRAVSKSRCNAHLGPVQRGTTDFSAAAERTLHSSRKSQGGETTRRVGRTKLLLSELTFVP